MWRGIMAFVPPPGPPPADPRQLGLGFLHLLSDEFLSIFVLPRLDSTSLNTLAACSSALYLFARDDQLWRTMCMAKWGHSTRGWRKRFDDGVIPNDYSCSECTRLMNANGAEGLVFKGTWRLTFYFPGPLCHGLHDSDQLHRKWRMAIANSFRFAVAPRFRSQFLELKWARCHMDLTELRSLEPGYVPIEEEMPDLDENSEPPNFTLQLVSGATLSPEEFRERFDEPALPIMITPDGFINHWKAFKDWSIDRMVELYGNCKFKVGNEYGTPRNVNMTFRQYNDYMRNQRDETPLYVFDGLESAPEEFFKDYDVPRIFEEDLFATLGAGRPQYRWIVVGPMRSGASWHQDPQATSAWNALLSGRKRWALYPPDVVPPGVFLMTRDGQLQRTDEIYNNENGNGQEKQQRPEYERIISPTSLIWYLEVYPTLTASMKPVEIVQEPGQTIFVPGGWWHMVLNLDEISIAVTQNYVGHANLQNVCEDLLQSGDEKMFAKFKSGVLKDYPQYENEFNDAIRQLTPTSDEIVLGEGYRTKFEFIHAYAEESLENPSSIWRKRLLTVQNRHADSLPLSPEVDSIPFEPILGGQNPVFQHTPTGNIVKFYTHLANGFATFASEVEVLRRLVNADQDNSVPHLFGYGTVLGAGTGQNFRVISKKEPSDGAGESLDPDTVAWASPEMIPWPWPYVVMSCMTHQSPIREPVKRLGSLDWDRVLPWLATRLTSIHKPLPQPGKASQPFHDTLQTITPILIESGAIPNDGSPYPPAQMLHSLFRTNFPAYINRRLLRCVRSQHAWGYVGATLLADLPRYLPRSFEDLVAVDPQFEATGAAMLHGDLSSGNILGRFEGKEWIPEHIIDFGDAFHSSAEVGGGQGVLDPLWDFVAMYISVMNSDPDVFHKFLILYRGRGLSLLERRRVMVYTLCYEFEGAVRWIKRTKPLVFEAKTWEEAEVALWGIV
ncbi:hypothetical protein BJ742DRAFT_782115 [Cladochytrium replicatum]|nr:hypothetical protein BJ742DRAFT_782115 [Cladochytrium replicatum]